MPTVARWAVAAVFAVVAIAANYFAWGDAFDGRPREATGDVLVLIGAGVVIFLALKRDDVGDDD